MRTQKIWHAEYRQDAKWVYVIDPDMTPPRYLRTHRCVLAVTCPSCGQDPGLACRGSSGKVVAEPHPMRKDLFYKRVMHEALHERGPEKARRGAG